MCTSPGRSYHIKNFIRFFCYITDSFIFMKVGLFLGLGIEGGGFIVKPNFVYLGNYMVSVIPVSACEEQTNDAYIETTKSKRVVHVILVFYDI